MNDALHLEIKKRLDEAKRVLLATHVRPDGDAIGAVLGLYLALHEAGKAAQVVLPDGVPVNLRHLPGVGQVANKASGHFDLIIALDCSDLSRLGDALDGYPNPHINIDHHITNLNYGEVNLVDPQAVATCEILAVSLKCWGLSLSKNVAADLLTGMITDTIGFRTSNMTPGALRVAADLMETGVDLPGLYSQVLVQRSFEAAKLWGAGLNRLERKGPIVWTSLTLADRQIAGYTGRDDADLINALIAIKGVDISLIFVEQPGGQVKVSWRSLPGYDVSKIALQFGGGGHPAASGATLMGGLDEVSDLILKETHNLLLDIHKVTTQ